MPLDLNALRDIADTIRAMLGEDEDTKAFLDTLDGETDVMDFIGKLIAEGVEADAMAEAMKHVSATYAARAARYAARKEATRKGLAAILDAIGEAKVSHPMGTVSRTKPRAKLDITDEAAIPSQLRKPAPPDTDAIKKALTARETIPGACLTYGEPGISVRVR